MKYRNPIITRVPFVRRKTIYTRVPTVKRIPIVSRSPISLSNIDFEGCVLCSEGCGCNGANYCSASTVRGDNPTDFRLIRIFEGDYPDEYWMDIIDSIEFVKQQSCNIRMISDVAIPNEVLFSLGYSPFNVAQYNLNVFDKKSIKGIRESLLTSTNCGIYTSLLLYPIMPEVTKSYDIIELLSSLQYSCRTLCFRFLELPDEYVESQGFYNVNGHLVPSKYMEHVEDKIVCNDYFKENFCTIMTRYMEPRKVSCSLCNDNVCY